jgi:multicomponent Na+:H+ antiporter subunit F
MSADTILDYAVTLALATLCLAFFVTIYRIIKGPTLPDRILGLDMLVAIAIGFIAVIGIKTGFTLYVDVAIALRSGGFSRHRGVRPFRALARQDRGRAPVRGTRGGRRSPP